MLKRIKNAITGFKANPEITKKDLEVLVASEDIGDGKAVFLGEGTHDEFLEAEKERKGLKGIFGL